MFARICLVILINLSLTSCSWFCENVEIDSGYQKPVLKIDEPDSLSLENVKFVIVTKDNAAKAFSELEKKGVEPVVFGLSDNDYAALARNMEALQGYILKYKELVKAYQEYYSNPVEDTSKTVIK